MDFGNHVDRPVRLEVRDGRELVVKTYRRGGSRQVYDDMLALWLSPFGRDRRPSGLPEPLSVDPATGELVMARVPGHALGARGALGDSVRRLPEVASLLADLHASGATIRRVRSADRVLASCRRKAADLSAACVGSRAEPGVVAVAEAADKVVRLLDGCRPWEAALVPSHGDFSPRNILGDLTGVVLVDLDRMQMADPAHDLAYWGAWTWATEAVSGAVPTWEVLGDLVSHYNRQPGPVARVSAGSLAFHQSAALLRIVHGWSALQDRQSLQRVLLDEAVSLVGQARGDPAGLAANSGRMT